MPKFSPFYLILCICLSIIAQPAFGQQKVWRHFTAEDGLPCQEVWSVLQARNGLIWFSTDNGMCWYDGYEFHQPIDTSTYKNSEAFFPFEDQLGRIWFSRLDKTIWFVENDTIRYWSYNRLFDADRHKFFIFDQSGIDDQGSIWLDKQGGGLVTVHADGRTEVCHDSDFSNFTMVHQGNKVFSGFQNTYREEQNFNTAQIEIVLFENGHRYVIDTLLYQQITSPHYWNAIPWAESQILLSRDHQIDILEGGKIKFSFPSNSPGLQLIVSKTGEVFAAPNRSLKPGLFYYASVQDLYQNQGVNLMKDYKIGGMLNDREGGIWVTALQDGIFYCANSDIDLLNEEFNLEKNNVSRLTSDGVNRIFVGINSNELAEINVTSGEIKMLPQSLTLRDWTAMHYDPIHDRLYAGSDLQYLKDGIWHPIFYFNPDLGKPGYVNVKTYSPDPVTNDLWMSGSNGFFLLNEETLMSYRMNFRDSVNGERTFVVVKDNVNRLWVGTPKGLRLWENNQFEFPHFQHSILKHQIRHIVKLPDGTLAFGASNGEILILEPDSSLIHLTIEQGLVPGVITMLKTGANDEIFVCTNKGLNQLIRQGDGSWKVKVISTKQGLPSDLIHDVVRLGDQMWIATGKGLVRMKSIHEVIQMPVPDILQFQVNHKDISDKGNLNLTYDQNNITIRFQSLHFKSVGNIWYRYRLLNADTTFQLTQSREINYSELSPGNYRFEVQAQREDNSWSESTILSFEIHPPWWNTWWFLSLAVLAIGAITTFIVRTWSRADRKKAKEGLRMKELELSALRAQINPHFIFNCLSSIQQFIAENNSDAATRYLARFAKLVRIALHSSVDGQHSLADEIEMLDNYLALEQMRFKNKFSYTITADLGVQKDELYIPAMLLQPFVENAVLHGVKGKMEKGLIEIHFGLQDGKLLASISDNGPGFQKDGHAQIQDHKSVGMTLTGKRLALINGIGNRHANHHQNLLNESNQIIGSKVTIDIPVN